jgi:quercetin dioxygenase-like cupin family protein
MSGSGQWMECALVFRWDTPYQIGQEPTMTQEAAQVAPHIYKVLFENERVRLLDVRMKPGDESSQHSHPDYLLYALEGGQVKLTDASGQSAEVDIHAGDTMWREAEEHSALNVGSTDIRALFVELK